MLELLEQNALPLIASGSALVIVSILLWIRAKRASIKASQLQKKHAAKLEKEITKTGKQLLEVRSVVVGLGQKVTEQQDIIQLLTERIVELEHSDSDGRLYSRASKMVQLGAGVNELIEECDIPKAEAELMMSLQQKMAAKAPKANVKSASRPPQKAMGSRRVTDRKIPPQSSNYR
jgi:hypothetical protein